MSPLNATHIIFTQSIELAGTENHCLKIAELFPHEKFVWIHRKQSFSDLNAESEAPANVTFRQATLIGTFFYLVGLRLRSYRFGTLYCVTPDTWILGGVCKVLLGCKALTIVVRNNTSHLSTTGRTGLRLVGRLLDWIEVNSVAAYNHFSSTFESRVYLQRNFPSESFIVSAFAGHFVSNLSMKLRLRWW